MTNLFKSQEKSSFKNRIISQNLNFIVSTRNLFIRAYFQNLWWLYNFLSPTFLLLEIRECYQVGKSWVICQSLLQEAVRLFLLLPFYFFTFFTFYFLLFCCLKSVNAIKLANLESFVRVCRPKLSGSQASIVIPIPLP